MGAVAGYIDIHDIPVSQWGQVGAGLAGQVVEARILCVHAFGVGVELIDLSAYGHVNPPRVTDGGFTVEETSKHIGEVKRAVVLAADPVDNPP